LLRIILYLYLHSACSSESGILQINSLTSVVAAVMLKRCYRLPSTATAFAQIFVAKKIRNIKKINVLLQATRERAC